MRKDTAKRHRWGGAAAISVFALAVAILGLIVVQSGVRAAGTFNPGTDVELSDYDSGANATVTTSFNVPAGDYNYSAMVTFTPAEFYVASADDAPIGTEVGTLSAKVTLGLINGPCTTPMVVNVTLMNCSTDTEDTVSFDNGFKDVNPANGLPDGCDKYPDFLNTVYPGITPRARMYGQTPVAGTDVSLNFVVFESGQAVPGVPSLGGYPSVTVLNDPTAPLEPSAITDFCAPLSTDIVTYGLADGSEMRRNPPYGGTYTFHWFTRSLPDADGDGLANDMDTCPFDPNTDSDADNDHIDDACDIDDATGNKLKGNDVDGDLYWNRQDNCPQVDNPDQDDADDDGIGDACDTEGNGPNVVDGATIEVTLDVDVEISGPSPPEPGADTDGDGFDDATEAHLGSCWDDPCDDEKYEGMFCSGTEAADSTPEDVSVAGTCTDEEDNDLDGYIDDVDGGCGDDTDGDGASDDGEDDLGSDPEDADSTPEDASVCDTCTDGVDNDGDGDIDAADDGCAAVEADVTPTPEEGTPTVEAETPTPVTETPTPTEEAEYCSPVFPGTYNGLVRVDGQPAASGYEVTASIDGIEWGSALVSGGRYAMDIPDHMPTEPPCFERGTITFALDAMECTPTADWASGIHTVDLSCAPAAPPVTPTPEVTPTLTPTPTITPTTVPPTGAGGLSGSAPGLPVWAMALAGWAGLTIVAGLGTLVAAKRR